LSALRRSRPRQWILRFARGQFVDVDLKSVTATRLSIRSVPAMRPADPKFHLTRATSSDFTPPPSRKVSAPRTATSSWRAKTTAITTSVAPGHKMAKSPASTDKTPYASIHPQALPSRAKTTPVSCPQPSSSAASLHPLTDVDQLCIAALETVCASVG
jgi:hypothetical protein